MIIEIDLNCLELMDGCEGVASASAMYEFLVFFWSFLLSLVFDPLREVFSCSP
jgi:hypothetical protein